MPSSLAPDLSGLAFDVDKLVALPGNPRRGLVDAIARSLDAFGQQKPIVARRSDHVVVAGNHTVLAARQLGWKQVAVSFVEMDDLTAKAYAVADNHTGDLASVDTDALAAMLSDIAVDEAMLAATSYTVDQLAEMLGEVEFDPVDGTARLDERATVTCPACGHDFVPHA